MGGLIVRDDFQLRRIDSSIAQIESRPMAEQRRLSCLLDALRCERAELLRGRPHAARPRKTMAVAA
jgi:hypothetical protein